MLARYKSVIQTLVRQMLHYGVSEISDSRLNVTSKDFMPETFDGAGSELSLSSPLAASPMSKSLVTSV
jgi:hypothetical protein